MAADVSSANEFWDLIHRARGSERPEDPSATPQALAKILGGLSDPEIVRFHQTYRSNLVKLNQWRLWAAGYVIAGGMSDDGFLYFRDWIIGKGRTFFDTMLASPEDAVPYLEDSDEFENEELGYVAQEVAEARSLELTFDGPEADGPPEGEMFDEETVDGMFPKLAAWAEDH